MNSDILQGKWNQLKGSVKETFGRLTDDDLMQVQGSADRMVGILQERYGYTKEQAKQEWDKFVGRYSSTFDAAQQSASNFVDNTKQKMSDVADKSARAAREATDRLNNG